MDVWLGLAVGVFIGLGISMAIVLVMIGTWYIGDLREDRSSDDERPYYFMEIGKGASGRMRRNRFVLLRVKRENYIL